MRYIFIYIIMIENRGKIIREYWFEVECEWGGEFGIEDCWFDEDYMCIWLYCEVVGDAVFEKSLGDDVVE